MNDGAIPLWARACIVLVEAKVQELATEITERVITTLKTDGRPLIPASVMARTKGESLVLLDEASKRFGLLYGTMRPTMKRLRM